MKDSPFPDDWRVGIAQTMLKAAPPETQSAVVHIADDIGALFDTLDGLVVPDMPDGWIDDFVTQFEAMAAEAIAKANRDGCVKWSAQWTWLVA